MELPITLHVANLRVLVQCSPALLTIVQRLEAPWQNPILEQQRTTMKRNGVNRWTAKLMMTTRENMYTVLPHWSRSTPATHTAPVTSQAISNRM